MSEFNEDSHNEIECTTDTRPMSPSEILQCKMNQLEPQQGTYLHVNLFTSSSPVYDENVKASLHEMAKLHYLLQAYVFIDEKGDYFFRKMKGTDVNSDWIPLQYITTNQPVDWVDIVNKDLDTKLDYRNGPLWRAIWIACTSNSPNTFSYVLVFVCSHCIMDAKCAVDLFANQFILILNGFMSGKVNPLEKKPILFAKSWEEIFVHPGIQKMYSEYQVPWYTRYGVSFAFWLFSKLNYTSKKPDMRVFHEKQKHNSCEIFPFDLDLDTSTKLQQSCKANSVSVHSVLLTVLAYSLKCLEDRFECYRANFKSINFPVDYRKFNKQLCTTPQPVGSYMGGSGEKMKFIKPTDKITFFKYCKELTAKIKTVNKPESPSIMIDIFVELLRQNQLETMIDALPSNVHLSNLGNCDNFIKTDPNGSIQLVGQYYRAACSGNTVFVSTATLNKKMMFAITYGTAWLSREFAENLAEVMIEFIHNVC